MSGFKTNHIQYVNQIKMQKVQIDQIPLDLDHRYGSLGDNPRGPVLLQTKTRPKPTSSWRSLRSPALGLNYLIVCLVLMMQSSICSASNPNEYLEGIGYREQALQQSKGQNFENEVPNGIAYASYAGGTHIFIKGSGLTENPQSNFVMMRSHELGVNVMAPMLSEDDAFNSHPMLGNIAYRLPGLDELLQTPMNYVSGYSTMTFWISVVHVDESGVTHTLECSTQNNCKVIYKRSVTPSLYYIQPAVVYYESLVNLIFDPRSVPNLITGLETDEMPFINAKVGANLIDFEDFINDESRFTNWRRNFIQGRMGELPAGQLYNISMLWETGNSLVHPVEATHCSYDMSECYQAKSVPVIYNQSSNTGYITGGMNLTVEGHGFNGQVQATLDGVNCKVTRVSDFSFSCTVESKDQASTPLDQNATYVGSNGLRKTYFQGSGLNWGNTANFNGTDELALALEIPTNAGDNYVNQFRGWFIPPATTRYRFYQVCDDMCKISMGLNTSDPKNLTEVIKTTSWTDYRDYYTFRHDQPQISDWVSLTEGVPYYMEAEHAEAGGGDHFTASVEIEATADKNTTGHHHSMKEVQYIAVEAAKVFETTKFTVTNLDDDGGYILIFTNPSDQVQHPSDIIPAKATADQFKNKIKAYYSNNFGSGINVNKTMFDVNGTETTNSSLAVTNEYYVTLTKLIDGVTTNSISQLKAGSQADVNITLPTDVQLSGAPLSGKFKIKCVSPEGYVSFTDPINAGYSDAIGLAEKIHTQCDLMGVTDSIVVSNPGGYTNWQNGFAFQIFFRGYKGDPGQFEIVSDDADMSPLGGTNLTFISNTTIPYSDNLFYEPIPFEFLRTYEENPQLLVSVNGVSAVCHNLTCDFNYTQPVGEITNFLFNHITKVLTIEGTSLPATMDDIQSVTFAHTNCVIDNTTLTNTTLECTLDDEPVCGNHYPIYTSSFGIIPNLTTLASEPVTCQFTAVSPPENYTLNLLGGDNLTFTGTNLPRGLSDHDITFTFNDAQQTKCVPQSSDTEKFVCLTDPFDAVASADSTILFTAQINGQTVAHNIQLTTRDVATMGLNLNPSSVSPVLKTKVTIQLENTFPYTLNRDDFSVNASGTANRTYFRQMNVLEVNDTAKTITCMFGGAESKHGPFEIMVRHKVGGIINSTGLILDVNTYVDSFSPKIGSIYGGQLIHVTGRNFGKVFTDNPIQISTNGGVDSIDCFLKSITQNDITCRIDSLLKGNERQANQEATMVVFLKVSEEATCDTANVCNYLYTDNVPQVTSISSSFDSASLQWLIKVEGTGFTGSTSDVSLEIEGVAQSTTAITATEATFAITNVSTQALTTKKLYFEVGHPKNHSIVDTQVDLTPRFASISPNTGSIGGTVVTAQVPGATVTSTNLDIKDSNGNSICQTIKVVSYGVIECKTKAQVIAASTVLKVTQGNEEYQCDNSDQSLCQYQQLDDGSFPRISSAIITDLNTISFIGTAFEFSNNYTPKSKFNGIEADTVTIQSSTSATAYYNLGVPISINASIPELSFKKTDSSEEIFAQTTQSLTNDISVTASSSSLTCSFAGGCEYQVTSNSLAIMLKNDSSINYITVCDEVCVFNETASSAESVTCNVPKVSTVYSNEQFSIATESEDLDSGVYFGTAQDVSKAFDGILTEIPSDTSSECSIGMKFKENHVGMISQVKWFMKYMDSNTKAQLVDITTFQGSNDGVNYQTLFTVDENIHSGWNYHKWETPADYPRFRYYRFHGNQTHACSINEITFTGVETIDNQDQTYTCPAKLVIGVSNIQLPNRRRLNSQTEKLIFEDNFESLNMTTWQHEIFAGGGGNGEFQYYTNYTHNSFTKEGVLHLQPTLTSDMYNEAWLSQGILDLGSYCTNDFNFGCYRSGPDSGVINPTVQSARIRSKDSFSFKYGRVEVKAKLPQGDWLWPAIWMLPTDEAYGGWPLSGEIDIMEARGNLPSSCSAGKGIDTFGSTMHWGPLYNNNGFNIPNSHYTLSQGTLADDYHIYELEWTEANIKTKIDGTTVMNFDFPAAGGSQDMYSRAGFPYTNDAQAQINPWENETDKNAPFNKRFHFILNNAVGGTNGYFPDGECGKNWTDHASFWADRDNWYPTWNYPASNDAALKIDYVKVYSYDDTTDVYHIDSQVQDTPIDYGNVVENHIVKDLNSVEFRGDLTTNLVAISPRFGRVEGGTQVTFSGTNFPTDTNKYTITIDGIVCPVDSANTTSVTCTTGSRPGLVESSLSIFIEGQGLVSTNDLLFRYVSLWSSDTTWGGEFAPMEGESIHVPVGLNLYVDIDRSPILNAVIVEGSIIFAPEADPNHERFFDARYIFVSGGLMEVGTEEFPYTSKITITMHGLLSDPYLPIYGNKVIGVRYGTLDMHGVERDKTWTVLDQTVEAGGTVIHLQEAVDWKAGEMIAIASTSYNSREGEHRTIKSVDSTRKILTLDQPLSHKHFAETYNVGTQGEFIDMRAEVGLLSRNVVFRGDLETSPQNQYGANIFLHSNGDDSLTCRLSYIELYEVGQAFKVGRYAVHFHMIGAVHNSYAKGLATHQGNNRAFTLHGTHYLRLEKNVAYEVKGHTFFIEDAVETNNYLVDNLVIKTIRSWSLLNTDQTPACFWITHPNNIFIRNHAAGSDRYGFWYDLQTHAMGPSANNDVCPENDKVGENINNTAHSMGRYGLRIFHNMVPRRFPCRGMTFDPTNPDDPYWMNPAITANFDNFVGWKNNRNGAIAEKVGDVHFNNFKTADNKLAGIEFSLTDQMIGDYAQVDGALIIGQTSNGCSGSPHGIIAPRTENFVVKGARFYNFDFGNAAAFGSCSHCFHPASTDEGGRTFKTSNLFFDQATMPRKIRWGYPNKAIIEDLDGTLTGLGPNTWATPYFRHHLWSGQCTHEADMYDGVICNNQVQVRNVKFGSFSPGNLLNQPLRVLQYDDSIIGGMNETELEAYELNTTNYGHVPMKTKPNKNWAQAWVLGHKYKIHFGVVGLDFFAITVTVAQPYKPTDDSIYFVHNFTDVREGIEFSQGGVQVPNNSIAANALDYLPGQNLVLNDTETRRLHFVMNAKNKTHKDQVQNFRLQGVRCYANCNPDVELAEQDETRFRLWSDPASWPSGAVPADGEDVEVVSGWNMIFDLNETQTENITYKHVQVNGNLFFQNETDIHFKAKHLYVRYGKLEIGNETHPQKGSVKITMKGEKEFEHMVYDNLIEAGNKIIANTGTIKMYGQPRNGKQTRLTRECFKDQTEIYVEPGLDWVAGDRIALGPTSYNWDHSEDHFVEQYDVETGKVTLRTSLLHHHWGAQSSTGPNYNGLDMRGEVILLTRSIVIAGEDIDSWGGQIVTSDTYEFMGGKLNFLTGQTIMDHVEIYNCSQWDTFKSALRFEKAATKTSTISNCAIHNGLGWGIRVEQSANINLIGNVIYNFRPVGVVVDFSRNIKLEGNLLMHVVMRTTLDLEGSVVDIAGGFCICSYFDSSASCEGITVKNNIATGVLHAGFIAPGDKCGETNYNAFYNNVAHSTGGPKYGFGALIYPLGSDASQGTCYEGSHFSGYKNYYMGAYGHFRTTEVRFHHMTMVDNREGFGSCMANGDSGSKIMLNDNHIYGESEVTDCPSDGSYCYSFSKSGFLLSGANKKAKPLHPTGSSSLPMNKIKGEGVWGTVQQFYRNKFHNFYAKTKQGARQVIFALNHFQADYHPMAEFYDTEFENVESDAIAFIMDPKPGWANIADCGNYPCTAPKNALIELIDNSFRGTKPKFAKKDFQIIADNSEFAPFIPECERHEAANAYICDSDRLAVLLFESLDPDRFDRAMQPIYVSKQGTDMANNLNAMMDHTWDGFYTGQIRRSTFPSIFEGSRRSVYDITFTGSPAKKMRFTLNAKSRTTGATIRIAYPSAESRSIVKDGQIVSMNQWDEIASMYGEIKQSFCGENRYIGVQNILEFYITTNCTLNIQPRDAIQTLVRMEWTFAEFFSAGGTTTFVDRLTASLGIHASQVKIVSVYEGSLVVNYEIEADNGQSLEELEQVQNNAFASGIDLGAPVLEFTARVSKNEDTTGADYQPVTMVNGEYAQSNIGIGNQFNPDIQIQVQESVQYNNVTVQVEREQETQVKQTTVVVEKSPEVIRLEKEKDPVVIIIPIALSIILIFIGIVACRYFKNKSDSELHKAQARVKRAKDLDNMSSVSPIPSDPGLKEVLGERELANLGKLGYKLGDELQYGQVNQRTANSILMSQGPEQYEQQYDPNNDFAIFGVGDKSRGGLQTMKEKMNLADGASYQEDSSIEEDGTSNYGGTHDTGSKMVIEAENVDNDLPEDKEIHSEKEEEEE